MNKEIEEMLEELDSLERIEFKLELEKKLEETKKSKKRRKTIDAIDALMCDGKLPRAQIGNFLDTLDGYFNIKNQ